MLSENPIYKHSPDELFDGPYYQAAKAIRDNDNRHLQLLLDGTIPMSRPINPNQVGKQGMTLLLWAASHDNVKATEVLLQHGADPNQKISTFKGDSLQLLAIAAGGKNDKLFDLLLQYKADPNSLDGTEPALFSAIYAERYERMHKLLDLGGDINITNSVGTPAIMVLARLRQYDQLVSLLERGAIMTDSVAKDIAYLVKKYPLASSVPGHKSYLKVRQILVGKGYTF